MHVSPGPVVDASAPGRVVPTQSAYRTVRFSELLAIGLRHFRLLTVGPALFTFLVLVLVMVVGRPYTAQSSFVLSSGTESLGRFSGLAAQFGLAPSSFRSAESPELYINLLTSRDVLRDVVLSEYSFPSASDPADSIRGNLLELYPGKEKGERARLNAAIHKLRRQVKVGTNLYSGVVSLRTKAPHAELAEQINRRLLDHVNQFNIERRMSQASIERQFIEERLTATQNELRSAEDRLKMFLEENRTYSGSPQLVFEKENLQRRVDLQHSLYTSLAQAYEQARVEEVRNTAVISIIDPPEGSAQVSIRLLMIVLAAGVFSTAIVLLIVFGREFMRREAESNPEGFEELVSLRRSALRRVLIFWERQQPR